MSFTTITLLNKECDFLVNTSQTTDNILIGSSLIFDCTAAVTLLVLGILGRLGIISMSLSACYALIGVSALFILADSALCVIAAVVSNSQEPSN